MKRRGPKKGPANKEGAPHVDARCLTEASPAGVPGLGGESQPPTRVPKSHLCNWFHGLCGRAQLSGANAKENPGACLRG